MLTEASMLASKFEARDVADMAALRTSLAGHNIPDIQDPIGHDLTVFNAIGSRIASLLPPVLELCGSPSGHTAD